MSEAAAALLPLSVVLPVFNGMPFVEESVRSILAQSFADFELVILNDGSTDGSGAVLRALADEDRRIRLVEADRRQGAAASSDLVVQQARAPLVARMDVDDIAHPDRLARQMAVMRSDPQTVLVGTLAETIDAAGRKVRGPDHTRLVRRSPFAPFPHASIMFRKDAFERVGGYRSGAEKWEDVDLFLRMAEVGTVMTLAEPLLRIRQTGASSRTADGSARFEQAMDLMYRCLEEYRAGRRYDDLLERDAADARLRPDVFVACGASALWAGVRPGLFRSLLRRGRLRPDFHSLAILVWSGWADLSPRTLRLASRALLSVRNVRARRRLKGAKLVEWRPRDARSHESDSIASASRQR